jgi:hypothetical protein
MPSTKIASRVPTTRASSCGGTKRRHAFGIRNRIARATTAERRLAGLMVCRSSGSAVSEPSTPPPGEA